MKPKKTYEIQYRTSDLREFKTTVTASSQNSAKDKFYQTYAKTCEILKIKEIEK